jgi:GTP-binding protein
MSYGLPQVVAIVGRPNVGKSSLFNRLTEERIAIVADEPGTTRDRVAAYLKRGDHTIELVDTGGLVLGTDEKMVRAIREQVQAAILESDLLLFVVDASVGLVPADEEIADLLRSSGKPVVLIVNKVDNRQRERLVPEFYALGMGEPVQVSAHHARGIDDVWERVTEELPPQEEPPELPEGAIPVAIVGRPNVGKSSLLNAVLGEERVMVSEIPGTTRDAIDTYFTYGDQDFVLIDTAGIRRRGHIDPGVERFSVGRALQAIDRADVAVLVVDATEYLTAQDLHVAGYVQEAVKGLVLVVNKWDLAQEEDLDRQEVEARIRGRLKFFPDMPILFVSALTGRGVMGVFDAVLKVHAERMKRVTTSQINRALMEAIAAHPPASSGRKRLQVYYGTQAEVNPPTFVFFTNDPSLVHFSYRRYLENMLRRNFGFQGTAIKLLFRGRAEREARAS